MEAALALLFLEPPLPCFGWKRVLPRCKGIRFLFCALVGAMGDFTRLVCVFQAHSRPNDCPTCASPLIQKTRGDIALLRPCAVRNVAKSAFLARVKHAPQVTLSKALRFPTPFHPAFRGVPSRACIEGPIGLTRGNVPSDSATCTCRQMCGRL